MAILTNEDQSEVFMLNSLIYIIDNLYLMVMVWPMRAFGWLNSGINWIMMM
jgi:hypothetical protein